MLVEKKLSEALKDYDKGKKVIVMSVMLDGSMSCDLLEDLFGNTETHFLVDVPACANPDFENAVQNMIASEKKLPPVAAHKRTVIGSEAMEELPPLKA